LQFDEQQLATYFIGAFVMFFLGVFVNHFLERKKEYRDYSKWQFGNLKDVFIDKYASDETRSYREKIVNSQVQLDLKSTELYKLAIAVQQLGFNSYLGVIPLEPILSGNGPQVVSDYLLVKDHIEAIRDENVNSNVIPFQRRHGEWIACICYMWLSYQKFELPSKDYVYVNEFSQTYGGAKGVAQREKLLFNSEVDLVKEHTRNFTTKIRRRFFIHRMKVLIGMVG